MKKVLLLGVLGTYNLGCEAIIRGTVAILKDLKPNLDIYYASYDYNSDLIRLEGCDVNIINRPKKSKWTIRNIIRKILSYFGINITLKYDSPSLLEGFDAVFSIGGDMYTISKNGSYNKELAEYGELCLRKNIPYILWGCSVGPFSANKIAETYFKKHLSNISLIVARENNTIDYLNQIGINNNVVFAPDPAFFVPFINQCNSSNTYEIKTVGINLSPLSSLYYYGSIDEAVLDAKEQLVCFLSNNKVDCILIPHVFSVDLNDNDLNFLELIYFSMPDIYRNRIKVLDNCFDFVSIKKVLIECDFVIAARMHCAINAISEGIPTVFLSYSEKSKGMAKLLFENTYNVLGITDWGKINLDFMYKVKDSFKKDRLDSINNFDFSIIAKKINL